MGRFGWSPVAALLIALSAVHLYVAATALNYSDFRMIHATAGALHRGEPAYAPDALPDGVWWNMNPPQLNLITWPLGRVALPLAATIFRIANLLAFCCAAMLTMSPGELLSRRGGWVLAAVISSPALVMQTGAGQVAGVLALIAAAAWRLIGKERWVLAGVLFGALCALKPIFAPVAIWLALRGQWRAVFSAAGTAAGIVLISVAVWGLQPQLDWARAVGRVTWFDSPFNMGWAALAWRTLGHGHPAYQAVITIGALLGTVLGVVARRSETKLALLQLLTGSILAAPLGWLYYLCVPGPLLMRWGFDNGRWPVAAWLLWIPLPLLPRHETAWWIQLTLGSAYSWGMLALTASLLSSSGYTSGLVAPRSTR